MMLNMRWLGWVRNADPSCDFRRVCKKDRIGEDCRTTPHTVSSQTKNLDFGGFDSSRFPFLRAGIPRPMGSFPESQSR